MMLHSLMMDRRCDKLSKEEQDELDRDPAQVIALASANRQLVGARKPAID